MLFILFTLKINYIQNSFKLFTMRTFLNDLVKMLSYFTKFNVI